MNPMDHRGAASLSLALCSLFPEPVDGEMLLYRVVGKSWPHHPGAAREVKNVRFRYHGWYHPALRPRASGEILYNLCSK